jgi:phosphocarrier protein
MAQEIRQEVEIKNELGLHARPATLLVQLALQFDSDIILKKDDEEVNGKSMMGILMLAAGFGTKLEVIATGDDAEEALAAIVNLVNANFDEEF